MASDPIRRYLRLDAMRALAAVAVMGYHVVAREGGGLAPLDGLFEHGYRGILVFFVLSGFLVARPFVRGGVAVDGYLVRRMARLLPAYLVALVGITLLTGDRQFPDHPLSYLLFLQNYDPSLLANGSLAATWTLQLEVQFYLLLPLLMGVLVLVDRGRGRLGLVILVLAGVISMLVHVVLGVSPDPTVSSVGSLSLPAMFWAFVPGIVVAWILVHHPAAGVALSGRIGVVVAMAAIAVGWLGSAVSPLGLAVQDTLLACGVALLLPAMLRDRTGAATTGRARPATMLDLGARFGRDASYPFYLWHLAVILVAFQLGLRGWPAFAVVLVGATAIGLASHRAIEAPAMRVGARWAERLARRGAERSAAPAPVVATARPATLTQDAG